MENSEMTWAGSERSCHYMNPKHELKIQKLLMCLFFAARDEVQVPSDTQAQVPVSSYTASQLQLAGYLPTCNYMHGFGSYE